jgi:hypothetical protein
MKTTIRSTLQMVAIVYITLSANLVSAATRTVCFSLVMFDDIRTDCPVPGTTGARRACGADSLGTNNDYSIGSHFQIWDWDGGVGDDFIGVGVTTNPNGLNCVTFEWENATYSGGEANPDVYIRLTPYYSSSNYTGNSPSVRVANATGASYPYVDFSIARAENCPVGVTCYIDTDGVPGAPIGALRPYNSTASNAAQARLTGDSAQRALQQWDTNFDPGTSVTIEYPDSTTCSPACAINRTTIEINANDFRGSTPPHELGHALQFQLFEQDNFVGDPGCTRGCP